MLKEDGDVEGGNAQDDPVLAATTNLADTLRRFAGHAENLARECDEAASLRRAGTSYREIADRGGPFIGEAEGPLRELLDAVGEYRRCQARALYDDGLTMARLGRMLGITRQRVAVLLDEKKRGSSRAEDTTEE
jgi:hypothetical protein